jgi:hypothetical protein
MYAPWLGRAKAHLALPFAHLQHLTSWKTIHLQSITKTDQQSYDDNLVPVSDPQNSTQSFCVRSGRRVLEWFSTVRTVSG